MANKEIKTQLEEIAAKRNGIVEVRDAGVNNRETLKGFYDAQVWVIVTGKKSYNGNNDVCLIEKNLKTNKIKIVWFPAGYLALGVKVGE